MLADDPDLNVVVYTERTDSATAEARRLLGSWAAADEIVHR